MDFDHISLSTKISEMACMLTYGSLHKAKYLFIYLLIYFVLRVGVDPGMCIIKLVNE